MRLRLLAVAALAVVVPAATHAQSVTIGTVVPFSTGCVPFACTTGFVDVTGAQQVYAASAFPGALQITRVAFFGTGFYAPANYTISLSVTSRPVAGLSTDLASNITGPTQVFFTGMLSGAFNRPTLVVGTPFVYDPALGNLLLSVDAAGYQPIGTGGLAVSGTPLCSQAWNSTFDLDGPGPAGPVRNDRAAQSCLVTRFDYVSAAVIPEPSPLTLSATALLGVGGAAYRRRRRAIG